jgi:imidazolonepropionase-like amidohydrolase
MDITREDLAMFACTGAQEPSPPRLGCLCHSPAFARLNAQFAAPRSRRQVLAAAGAATLAVRASASAAPVPDRPAAPVVFVNLRLFDGTSAVLRPGLRVIVEGGVIRTVESDAGPTPAGARVLDCGGGTLMPGLIDAHYHIAMASVPLRVALSADPGYLGILAAGEAERVLMRGFTSIRDMAGPSFAVKRAVDEGRIPGPRIWPSGAMISQTSGHGDYRSAADLPWSPMSPLSLGDRIGGGTIADGAAEVLRRAREQLMLGATQLKLAAGGGVASDHDPLDVSQYTEAEFRAAVDAAENWGTYVAVHAYTPRAIQVAIRGGVRCVEHGQLMDQRTAEIMAERGTWVCMQPFLDDADAIPFPEGSANRAKQLQMVQGTDIAYGLAKRHNLRTAWGTDALFDPRLAARQGAQLAKMVRWYAPAEVLRMATGTNAELLAMSGPRTPYPGKLGVVEAGALADLLVVDGDPIAQIRLLEDPESRMKVIMKDGRLFKNMLA